MLYKTCTSLWGSSPQGKHIIQIGHRYFPELRSVITDDSYRLSLLFYFRTSDDLLIECRDVHAETPPDAGEYMCSGWQADWKAIDGGLLHAIHHPAYAPLEVDPVQTVILVTNVLRPNLILGFEAPEVPICIIRGTKVCSHVLILLRKLEQITTETINHTELF